MLVLRNILRTYLMDDPRNNKISINFWTAVFAKVDHHLLVQSKRWKHHNNA